MNTRNTLRQDRLSRVATFGTEYSADIPAGSEAIQRFANIAAISASLDRDKVGQLREPASLQTLLDALWLDFKDIARTARSITLDEPGFSGPYRLPEDATFVPIKTHADSLLTRLEDKPADSPEPDSPTQLAEKAALRAKFIQKLMHADFVQDLRADRNAIDGKTSARTADNLQGVQSTESIDILLLQGGEEVIRLDAMMQNLFRREPAKLHAWLTASRVHRSPKRSKDEEAPPSPPVA